ncbi:His/Gly/Thr/Pro-type tRNA ligase C-terminal domain-containing protein, partial [Methylophaga sp.]|uniref:His/Gly/Thr/Pro-type tRNA ligase C-terminal domain-containing protein n=1 Tax=Methylophaga sp. TaxID=2024840 RepID=UPI0027241837
DWQCGTLQVDMNLPERFNLEYVADDGQRKRPVMLHRALFGSLERFIGILLEHHAGKLPLWLAPVQVKLLSISDAHAAYVNDLASFFCRSGIRAEADIRNEKIGYKIREHTLQRIPFMCVIGDQEMANASVAIRNREGENLGVMDIEQAMDFFSSAAKAPDAAAGEIEKERLFKQLQSRRVAPLAAE